MTQQSLKKWNATSSQRQGDSRKGDRHANRKRRSATGPQKPIVSAISIIRQHTIDRGRAEGWSKARIVYVIYQHERRCGLCQLYIAIDQERTAKSLNTVRRRP